MTKDEIKRIMPPLSRAWIKCQYCGMKYCLADNKAECRGIFVKCTRGCGREFQIIVKDGKQIMN